MAGDFESGVSAVCLGIGAFPTHPSCTSKDCGSPEQNEDSPGYGVGVREGLWVWEM